MSPVDTSVQSHCSWHSNPPHNACGGDYCDTRRLLMCIPIWTALNGLQPAHALSQLASRGVLTILRKSVFMASLMPCEGLTSKK